MKSRRARIVCDRQPILYDYYYIHRPLSAVGLQQQFTFYCTPIDANNNNKKIIYDRCTLHILNDWERLAFVRL